MKSKWWNNLLLLLISLNLLMPNPTHPEVIVYSILIAMVAVCAVAEGEGHTK